MDLFAYAQIGDLEQIAKDNGIEIPRLRGYRLMKDEVPVSKEEIAEMKKSRVIEVAQDLCSADPFWSLRPQYYESSWRTDYIKDFYLVKGKDENGYKRYVGIRWDRIHGKKRKILKFAIKKANRRIDAQYEMWNRYAGKENILYIHSRMGGNNWKWYGGKRELMTQPWFLDRVDDYWDSTYCDFYAWIK